jgi:hypothetical protein
MLKNASEVTLVPNNILFLKFLNFVQSFVECKVSLADCFTDYNFLDDRLCHMIHLTLLARITDDGLWIRKRKKSSSEKNLGLTCVSTRA